MNKNETINKIMEEYSDYGTSRIVVEILYLLAVGHVAPESIYPGLRLTLNKVYGIHDDVPAKEAGIALFNAEIDGIKQEHPSASNKDIANAIELMGVDNLEESLADGNFSLLSKVKESILNSTKEFVKVNK